MLTPEQREQRKQGIGGTDAAAILGVNPFKSAFEIWLEKTGRLEPEDISHKPAVYWGNVLEDIVAKEYSRTTGNRVRKVNETLKHPEYSWLIANLDRRVIGNNRILECKTAGAYSAKDWGPPDSDQVPEQYIIQVQHYLAVTNCEAADLAVLIGGNDFRTYHIPRDESLINYLINQLNAFWNNHVLTDMPPQPNDRSHVTHLWPNDNGTYIELQPEQFVLFNEYQQIRKDLEMLEQKRNALEAEICQLIGEASGIRCNEKIIATWRATKKGNRIFKYHGVN